MIELILIADIWIVPSSSVLFLQVDMVQPAKSSSSSMFQLCTFWIPPWWWDYLPACFQHASGMCCRLTLISFRSNAGIFGIVTVYPKRINQKYTKNVYITGYLLGSLHPLFFRASEKTGSPTPTATVLGPGVPCPKRRHHLHAKHLASTPENLTKKSTKHPQQSRDKNGENWQVFIFFRDLSSIFFFFSKSLKIFMFPFSGTFFRKKNNAFFQLLTSFPRKSISSGRGVAHHHIPSSTPDETIELLDNRKPIHCRPGWYQPWEAASEKKNEKCAFCRSSASWRFVNEVLSFL